MALLHRGEPSSATDFDSSRSPLRRASTPRPSISPLSVASKANPRSPLATRDATIAGTNINGETEADNALDTAQAEVGEHHDDRSSSLSEPEDDQDDIEEQQGTFPNPEDREHVGAHQSVEVDSEAETTRLEETPRKLRIHGDDVGKTPSKLSQAATAEDDLSEPPSPLPVGPGAASSTSTIATTGNKRKRSDTAESPLTSAESDIGESPRKRSQESSPERDIAKRQDNATADKVAEAVVEDTLPVEETPIPVPIKGAKGRRGKYKGRKPKDAIAEPEQHSGQEAAEADDEPSDEAAAKTEERRHSKTQASTMYEEVSKQFMAFREKLYNERLATMSAELDLLAQPECQHPEYLRQVACVNARLEKQTREAHAFYYYRLKSIKQRTLGDRSQLHSQYFQFLRDQREKVMYEQAEDWHNIQKERRQSHQEKDEAWLYKYQVKKSAQIRQQAKYNQEVSVLSGIAKYVGFPAAPEITGAQEANQEDDLKAMKIPRRVPQATAQPQTAYPPRASIPIQAQSERDAHQQFIEQNAWAQPQRPIHHRGTPNLTHTPDWAEPGPTRNLIRNLSGQIGRMNSPFMTPMPQKRAHVDGSSSGTVVANSDGPEPPSSVLAAPPTSDRVQFMHHVGANSNFTSPVTVTKPRQRHGTGERELTGFRNISGRSGASTIDASSPPPDPAERDRHQPRVTMKQMLPALHSEASAPQQVFDTSQLHRHGEERREVYANVGFRSREGAFGTPAPLSAAAPARP